MRQDERTLEVHLFYDLQSRERFAETHLGVPKHLLTAFAKLLLGLVDGSALLRAEDDGALPCGDLGRRQRNLALLHSRNSTLNGFKVRHKPFIGLAVQVESLAPDA